MLDNALDLTILDSGSGEHAVAMARAGDDVALARLPFGTELAELTAFRSRIENAIYGKELRPKAAELHDFGQKLFSFAIRDDILMLYHRIPTTHMRLQILSDQPQLQVLPFEFLQEPNQIPGPRRERSVVRVVPTVGVTPTRFQRGEVLRVLFVSADPVDQGPVSWAEVKARLERVFAAYAPAGRVQFEAVQGADRRTVRELIASRPFDVFHFSGHANVDATGKGRIILQSPRKPTSDPVDAVTLARWLSGRGVKLVILSACDTAAGDFRANFAVFAQALVRAGIPAVVANQLPVPDSSVSIFVGAVYEALLRTGDIDVAMSEGRNALADLRPASDDAVLEWGIPALYRHLSSPMLYVP